MKYLLLPILILICMSVSAQDYFHALGVRTGYASGISYKRFFTDETAMEALMTFQRGGTQLTILRQFHNPIFLKRTDNLFFYYGYGLHAGYRYWSNQSYNISGSQFRKREISAGMAAVANIGIEYHATKHPIVICVDYKPFFEVNFPKYFRRNVYDFAIIFRYLLQ